MAKQMRLDLIAFFTATLIAFQARANGELSHLLGNPIQAATVSFGSGLLVISLVAAKHHGMKQGLAGIKRGIAEGGLKPWNLFAGMLGGIFVSIQTNTVPLIGVAIYSVASISGQTASSLIVDSFGLAGGSKKHITFRRIFASLITVLAVLVSVWDRIDANDLSLIPVALAGLAGVMIASNYGNVHFYMGFIPGLKAFTAAVLGGIGNLQGAMLGGLLLGLIESLGAGYIGELTGGVFGSNYQDIFAFLVLILVLVLRPTGLLGEKVSDRA